MNRCARYLLAAVLISRSSFSSCLSADWPQWRGINRDGRAADTEQFPSALSAEPKLVWRIEIGGGFSSPVVAGGKLVYQDVRNGKEIAHLIDAKSGKEIWSTPYAAEYQD